MSVCGDNALMLKPVPVMLLPEIETAAVPEFEIVTAIDALEPISKVPKFTLDGLALSPPCVPVPLSGMDSEPFVALDVIIMLPDTAPAAVGENVVEKLAIEPAGICWPALMPLVLNPEPAAVT